MAALLIKTIFCLVFILVCMLETRLTKIDSYKRNLLSSIENENGPTYKIAESVNDRLTHLSVHVITKRLIICNVIMLCFNDFQTNRLVKLKIDGEKQNWSKVLDKSVYKLLIIFLIQGLVCTCLPLTKMRLSTDELCKRLPIKLGDARRLPSFIFDFHVCDQENQTVWAYPFSLNQYANDVVKENRSGDELMRYEWLRYLSFSNFPQTAIITPMRLAQAGFHYLGRDESVRCFCCGVINDTWRTNDTAFDVHRRISANCDFIRGRQTNNVTIHNSDYYTSMFITESHDQPVDRGMDNTASGGQHHAANRYTDSGRTDGAHGNSHYVIDTNRTSQTPGEDVGVQNNRQSKHPAYSTFEKRLESFANWQFMEVQCPKRLAEAGFFYTGVRDIVRCHICGVGAQSWSREDIPLLEHARMSPNCSFVTQARSRRESDAVRSSPRQDNVENGSPPRPHENGPLTNGIIPNGIHPSVGTGHISEERSQGAAGKSATPEAATNDKKADKESTSKASGKPNSSSSSETRQRAGMSAEAKAIIDENRSLRAQMTCKICLDRDCDVVFLPCGHMVACQHCGRELRKCAICRNLIRGMVHVYQS